MNRSQRTILTVYVSFAICVILLNHLIHNTYLLFYFKFTIMVSLMIAGLLRKNKRPEQRIMSVVFIFLVIGDVFLVLPARLTQINHRLLPLGAIFFLIGYLLLISIYHKKQPIKMVQLFYAVPVFLLSGIIALALLPYMGKGIQIGAIIFGLTISIMVWTALSTLSQNYFSEKISRINALSSILMYICDMSVGFYFYYPFSKIWMYHVINDIIWLSYILGWAMLLMSIYESQYLYSTNKKSP